MGKWGPDLASHVHDLVSAMLPAHPLGALWIINIDPRLTWRFNVSRALFAAIESPEILDRPVAEFTGFQAMQNYMPASRRSFESFFEPALVVRAPWVLGMLAPSFGHSLVWTYGAPTLGSGERSKTRLLDLFRPTAGSALPDHSASLDAPPCDTAGVASFLRWWCGRIDLLLSTLSDPSRFRNTEGSFNPSAQLAVYLSFERLFSVLGQILRYRGEDGFTRLNLFFGVVDLLCELTHEDYGQLQRWDHLEPEVERLERELPPSAAAFLLPVCKRAVAALREVGDAFFVTERIDQGGLRVRTTDGQSWDRLPMGTATAEFLHLARNATHSYVRTSRKPRERSLMAAHDGTIPTDVADLALLNVVRLLHDLGTPRSRLRDAW